MVSFLSEVDFHGEGVAASGAAHDVRAAAAGETKGGPAMRTLVINMGGQIPQAIPGEGKEAGDLPPYAQKRLVFPPTCRNIAGKTAEKDPERIGEEKRRENVPAGKEVQDREDDIDDEQGVVQLIAAIAAIHETHEPLLEFCHKKRFPGDGPVR